MFDSGLLEDNSFLYTFFRHLNNLLLIKKTNIKKNYNLLFLLKILR